MPVEPFPVEFRTHIRSDKERLAAIADNVREVLSKGDYVNHIEVPGVPGGHNLPAATAIGAILLIDVPEPHPAAE